MILPFQRSLRTFYTCFVLISIILLTACSGQEEIKDRTQTVTVTSTPVPSNTITMTPVLTSTPVPNQTPTLSPTVSSSSLTTHPSVIWIGETIPDGTHFEAGQHFTKTWTIKNGGQAAWSNSYALALISASPSGENLGGPDLIPLPHEVQPGEEVEIQVDLIAPQQDGQYTVTWQLKDENGELIFGSELWVTIIVGNGSLASAVQGSVTAQLVSFDQNSQEISIDFCMEMPDNRAWYPWNVIFIVNNNNISPSSSQLQNLGAVASGSSTQCFRFSFLNGGSLLPSGTPYQLSIGQVSLPPEIHQDENCAYAKDLLKGPYPGLSFACGGPGFFYTSLVTPPGMSTAQADQLIMDAMSHTINGPWILNSLVP